MLVRDGSGRFAYARPQTAAERVQVVICTAGAGSGLCHGLSGCDEQLSAVCCGC